MQSKEGYNNKLYYPHLDKIHDGGYTAEYILLASASSTNKNQLIFVRFIGDIGGTDYNYYHGALRPVICINENQKLDVKE